MQMKKPFTRIKESSNLTAAILLVLTAVVLITLVAERYYLRWDLTAAGQYTLSEKTLQLLHENLNGPVHIKAFIREDQEEGADIKELLASYRYQAPQIDFELIDPDRHPALTRQYNVTELNTLVLQGFGRTQIVKPANEEGLTTGLIRLLENEVKHIYWTTGHGERSLAGTETASFSKLTAKLSQENFAFHELALAQKDVPADAGIVIIAGPTRPLFNEEIDSLKRYLYRGGNLLILLDPFLDAGLKEFLQQQGILIASDIVVDKLSRVMGGDYLLPLVTQYGPHPICKGFRLNCLFAEARSVEKSPETKPGIILTNLAFTSPGSWAETDLEAFKQGKVGLEPNDRPGPISLAVIAELEPPQNSQTARASEPSITGKGKLVVFGDSDFAGNKYFETAGNSDLISNTINYLVERGKSISIAKKEDLTKPVLLNPGQILVLFLVTVVLIPLTVLVIGIVVWRKRRPR